MNNDKLKEVNDNILKARLEQFNLIPGARLGDFIKLPSETGDFYTRITHIWEGDNMLQTGGSAGNAYYLGNGYLSYSGGLDPGLKADDLIPTDEKKQGLIWFFSNNESRAHNGVEYSIEFRVFTIKEGADIHNLYDYSDHLKKIMLSKLPTITRINGNGNPYTLPLPEIMFIDTPNEIVLSHIEKNTGLKFIGGKAQTQTHEQLCTFFLSYNYEYKYYCNSMHANTIIIKSFR